MSCTRMGSVSLLGGLALAACFSDAPPLDDESSSDASASSGGSSSGATTDASLTQTPTSDGDTSGSPTVTTDASTTSTSTADTSTDDSSTTGPVAPECGCPPSSVLCEDFEDELGDEWGFPSGGEGAEGLDSSEAYCGGSSLQTQVIPDSTYAVAVGVLDTTIGEFVPTPYTARVFVWIGEACAGLSDSVRLFAIQTMTGGLTFDWDVAVNGDGVFLRSYIMGTVTDSNVVVVPVDEWVELRLDLDYDVGAEETYPFATLHVGGGDSVTSEPMIQLPNVFDTAPDAPQVALGPYYYAMAFPVECTIWYDDVWVAPTR